RSWRAPRGWARAPGAWWRSWPRRRGHSSSRSRWRSRTGDRKTPTRPWPPASCWRTAVTCGSAMSSPWPSVSSATRDSVPAQVAMVNMLQRQYEPALAAAEPALEAARRLGDDRLLGRTLITLGATEVVMGDAHRGVALLKEARELGERVGAADVSRLAVWMLGSGAGGARLYHEAEEALAALVAAAVDTDDDAALAYGVAWQARIAFERGEYERALRLAERVPPRPGHGIIGPITALGAKGRTMVRLGQPGAGDVLRQALAVSPHAALQYIWSPWCGLAELAWLEGREGDIPGLLAHVLPLVLASDSPWARGEVSL